MDCLRLILQVISCWQRTTWCRGRMGIIGAWYARGVYGGGEDAGEKLEIPRIPGSSGHGCDSGCSGSGEPGCAGAASHRGADRGEYAVRQRYRLQAQPGGGHRVLAAGSADKSEAQLEVSPERAFRSPADISEPLRLSSRVGRYIGGGQHYGVVLR